MNELARFAKILENATSGANVDRSKTFVAWHHRSAIVRQALLNFKDERDEKIEYANQNYRGRTYDNAIEQANKDFDDLVKIANDKVLSDLQDVVESKEKAWSKANSAPSNDMLNLLRVLEMRGNDLSSSEIVATVEKLNNNAPALRALKSICSRAGLALPSFVGADPEAFERNMERAVEYAMRGTESLATSTDDLPYMDRLFWTKPGEGLDHEYFDVLDRTTLTSAEVVPVEPDEADQSEQADQANQEKEAE